jgi:hypothetical protein
MYYVFGCFGLCLCPSLTHVSLRLSSIYHACCFLFAFTLHSRSFSWFLWYRSVPDSILFGGKNATKMEIKEAKTAFWNSTVNAFGGGVGGGGGSSLMAQPSSNSDDDDDDDE